MSGLWGPQTALDLYLQEEGITTLMFCGVNADQVRVHSTFSSVQRLTFDMQCVLGTVIDSYYRGYDIILVEDATATTSPEGGMENVVYNIGNVCFFRGFNPRVRSSNVAPGLWIRDRHETNY